GAFTPQPLSPVLCPNPFLHAHSCDSSAKPTPPTDTSVASAPSPKSLPSSPPNPRLILHESPPASRLPSATSMRDYSPTSEPSFPCRYIEDTTARCQTLAGL